MWKKQKGKLELIELNLNSPLLSAFYLFFALYTTFVKKHHKIKKKKK